MASLTFGAADDHVARRPRADFGLVRMHCAPDRAGMNDPIIEDAGRMRAPLGLYAVAHSDEVARCRRAMGRIFAVTLRVVCEIR